MVSKTLAHFWQVLWSGMRGFCMHTIKPKRTARVTAHWGYHIPGKDYPEVNHLQLCRRSSPLIVVTLTLCG